MKPIEHTSINNQIIKYSREKCVKKSGASVGLDAEGRECSLAGWLFLSRSASSIAHGGLSECARIHAAMSERQPLCATPARALRLNFPRHMSLSSTQLNSCSPAFNTHNIHSLGVDGWERDARICIYMKFLPPHKIHIYELDKAFWERELWLSLGWRMGEGWFESAPFSYAAPTICCLLLFYN